jgi:lantibiotic biosynthesis protein
MGWGRLFLSGAEVLGQPALRSQALRIADRMAAATARPGARWPSGVLGGGDTPGLMLGLAGTGAVPLHAAEPERAVPVGLLCGDRPPYTPHG